MVGAARMELKKNDIDKLLASIDTNNEPAWTEEEGPLSTPYSYVRSWERILEGQYIAGRGTFNGPPGMKEKVKAQIDKEGIAVARERYLEGVMANGEPFHPNPERP